MIVGIGADLVEVLRIEQSIRRFGSRFLGRIYTEEEQTYASAGANAFERFAARFAAKEAAFKALGMPWSDGMSWQDIEVRSRPGLSPELRFLRAAERFASRRGVNRVLLTLTHTSSHALAFVVLEG